MYVYVCMCGHHIWQSMDQQSKVVNPSRGQLNREPRSYLRILSHEMCSAVSPASASSFSTLELIWCLLTGFLSISAAASISLFKPNRHTYAIVGSVVPSLSGHAIAHRWRSLPRVRWHRANSPRGSSSNGCCLRRSPWTN